jgi:sulfate adenylyltransferase
MSQTPYKGTLVDLLPTTPEDGLRLKKEARSLTSFVLTPRQQCDVELLINGGFSPLRGFLNQKDYDGVVEEMRLSDGTLWPIPIVLDVSQQKAEELKIGQRVALKDLEDCPLAILTIESIWEPNKAKEAEKVFGSPDDATHPSIYYLFNEAGSHYVGGPIEGIQLPTYYDFTDIRLTPKQLRAKFQENGWDKIVGFQTRNPMHRSHRELTVRAAAEAGAHLLVHPVVGQTKPGDVDHYTRVRCYKEIMKYYPEGLAELSLLPLAMRMGGPKEAVWHAIIRKNYGLTHFIVGRDHAGPGNNKAGEPFYDPYAAQTLLLQHAEEIGIKVMKYNMVVFVEGIQEYKMDSEVEPGQKVLNISGTELRRRLFRGIDIPEWFSYPSVVKLLRQTHPPRNQQGFTLFFTGLSGAGKSTLANAIRITLMEEGSRPVTLLDGDEVRMHLSSELGFSKEHRNLNIRRISWVASQITKSRGIAIIAAIAPYLEPREFARKHISKNGGFVEIHVATPLEVCESRDVKGLYAKARNGVLKNFTGIDDPYEAPINPELFLNTSQLTIPQCIKAITDHLKAEGYLDE